ncbi:MAG: hypothetical protein LBD41_06290 [Clostridiales Family XIII bacterium]|jgi:hypothetical protein|nr:hypothetical protein [Clostridiales Family XIII bacterium]
METLKFIMFGSVILAFTKLFGLLGFVTAFIIAILLDAIFRSDKKTDNKDTAQQENLPNNSISNNKPNTINKYTINCPKCNQQISLERNNDNKIIKCLSCGLFFKPADLNNFVDISKI